MTLTYISNSIQKNRVALRDKNKSIKALSGEYILKWALYYIEHLEEHEIDKKDLYDFLYNIFIEDPDILSKKDTGEERQIRTRLRRLIRIYDYLEYSK